MTQMAQYQKGGFPQYCDYTPPSVDVNAGDVVAINDTLLICNGGVKSNGAGTGISAGRLGAMVCRGGFFLCAADGAIPIHTAVYWNAGTSQITLTSAGNKRFGITGDIASVNPGDVIPVEFAPGIPDRKSSQTVAAVGTNQATAVALLPGYNEVTGATGNAGVGAVLPTPAEDGVQVIVNNSDAANAILLVYPGLGGYVNALAVNTAIQMAAKSSAIFTYLLATATWHTTPKVPS